MNDEERTLRSIETEMKKIRENTRDLVAGQAVIDSKLTKLGKTLPRVVCAAAVAGAFVGAFVAKVL